MQIDLIDHYIILHKQIYNFDFHLTNKVLIHMHIT